MPVKQLMARFKPLLRWLILGGTLFFLLSTLRANWQDVATLRLQPGGLQDLAIAFGLTLIAHLWSGWVWSWILRTLGQPANASWSIRTYLKTNLAKYLPGNVWHFYGRVMAAKEHGVSLGAAAVSVVLEPLLMAASALMLGLLATNQQHWGIQGLGLVGVLVAIHPQVLNPVLQRLGKLKQLKRSNLNEHEEATSFRLQRYPLIPLLGEFGFVVWRGAGFLFTAMALTTVAATQIPSVLGGFSISYLLGLVVPGAPGGMGVFEATAIALLQGQFTPGLLLSTVALYRVISILAEVTGAGLAWLYERCLLKV